MAKKVNATVETIENVIVANETKGFKPSNSNNVTKVIPTVTETKNRLIAFIRNKEEIGLNKFFKLLDAFKKDDKDGYTDFLIAQRLPLNEDYSFKWFTENCPSMEIDGKKEFAKWVKVTDSTPANENEEYNRLTEKGILQTLKPYYCYKANYEQYLSMFCNVIAEKKRKLRIAEKERKEKEKLANAEKAAKEKEEKIAKLKKELEKLQAA